MKVNNVVFSPIVLGLAQLLIMALVAPTSAGPLIRGPVRCNDVSRVSGTTGPAFPGGAGIPVTFEGHGQVTGEADMGAITFTGFQMTGSSPQLGNLTLSLNPAQISTGVIIPLPAGSDESGFVSRNSFFLRITTDIQNVALVSNQAHEHEATISSFPPTATYHMIHDTDFYVEGDPQQTTVFTMHSGTTDVSPAPVPAVSDWGVGALALMLLSAVAIKFGRRRAVMA